MSNVDEPEYQGNKLGTGIVVGDRGPLHDRGNARSSPHLSMITLGCLNGGDERGG